MINNALIIFTSTLLFGCATIVNGPRQTVSILSDPPGAVVTVGGEYQSQTPVALPLKRGKDYALVVRKEGYKEQTLMINSEFDHWIQATLGNFWNYIIPGLIVDTASGSAYEFNQTLINVKLEKE